ncbi:MAG: alpha/beta hydrolase fold domain-containing protein, partial [Actinomycetota bacterium]
PELEASWEWSEKYATQPEILRYLDHVATRHDLRRDVRFGTRVAGATWNEGGHRWHVATDAGDTVTARHVVMATGCLSRPKDLDIPGIESFDGEIHTTGRWPHEGVDFTGKRVAVIGTGSSGIQSIPIIARECAELTVFQRTPNFSIPAGNGPIPDHILERYRGREREYREEARWSGAGVPGHERSGLARLAPEDERAARFEASWNQGELLAIGGGFADIGSNEESNALLADFVRDKIRSIVDDPATAELLCPTDHPIGTKRPCLDSGYYETYNLPHVDLVDLRTTPISAVTATGIQTTDPDGATTERPFDVIVLATGFDAMTGAIVAVDIEGRDGTTLKQKWADGPLTYLGLTVTGFPNFFTVTGPGSPSVLSNMAVSIEQHVEWISDCLSYLRDEGLTSIEATPTAEAGWVQHVNDAADMTLYHKANSWYMGANVPGKPRVFLPFVGGVGAYRAACDEVVARDYLGFRLRGDDEERCNDGVIRRIQPDVNLVLMAMEQLGLPPLESLGPDGAREFMALSAAQRPPGPEVGEVVDGTWPGPAGELAYRCYRPPTEGPHPLVVYFHGGGWVLGHQESDDPFCRDLCVRSDAVVVSFDYRHAPEARFPAAAEDAVAAVRWAADHAADLGAEPGRLALAGWSAGGNLAAVACQVLRDTGGPAIAGQLLITPVTDHDPASPSLAENAEGYVLTRSLMEWFWDNYADEADRTDPRAAPIRGDLTNLPPAVVITCEFDPLRDQGKAYAEALAAAGNQAEHKPMRGQIHTSLHAVDVVITGAPARAEMAAAIRRFLGVPAPV